MRHCLVDGPAGDAHRRARAANGCGPIRQMASHGATAGTTTPLED
jgi:hypothetical protein